MYKINFLTARKKTPEGIVRKYFEENCYLSNEFVDLGLIGKYTRPIVGHFSQTALSMFITL